MRTASIAAAAVVACGVLVAAVQPRTDATIDSARRAKAVLDAGIAALGGLDALQAIDRVSLREKMTVTQIAQSMTPKRPFDTVPGEDTLLLDRRGRRVYAETVRALSYFTDRRVVAIDGAQGFALTEANKTARALPESSHQQYFDRARRLPHFLLLGALERAHSLRDLGEETFEGRRHRVIAANVGDGETSHLFFDRGTNLLTKVQSLYPDAYLGDVYLETLFTGYHADGAYQVPAARTVRRGGEMSEQAEIVAVAFNPAIEASRFAPPADFAKLPAHPAPPRNAVRTLAKDVYLFEQIDGVGNAMAIAFDAYVLVVDVPEDRVYRRVSESVIRLIRETIPGRPIRYVVPTHYHGDHGTGLRPYIAEGVTIVTTPGNVDHVREIAALRFPIRPDALALKPRAPIVETLERKQRIFRDATHVVELHDIGPERHVNETIAAWLPNERILFLADLYETGYAETATWDGKGMIGDLIARFGWSIDTVVTPHSRPRRLAELRPAS